MAKPTDKKVSKKEEKAVDKKVEKKEEKPVADKKVDKKANKKEEEAKKKKEEEERKKREEEEAKKKAEEEEEESSSEEEEEEKSSSEEEKEESSEEEEEEKSSSEEESSEEEDKEDEEEDDEEEEDKSSKKRKQSGDDDDDQASKKQAVASTKCFVGSLSFNTDDDGLKKAFSKYGKVTFAKVSLNEQGRSKGFGFVEFDKEESAQKALEMNGADLDGRQIKVEISQTSRDASKPRTGGGASGEATKVLFVGNLSFNTDKDSLLAAFEGFEGLNDARIATERETGRPRGFGYLEFSDAESAKAAFEQMNGADVDGRNIRLDYAAERTGDAPRGGSDRGGRGGFRGGRGGDRGGFRGGFRGGRGGGGDRGGRGGFRGGRGGDRGGFRGGRGGFEGKKMTFDD